MNRGGETHSRARQREQSRGAEAAADAATDARGRHLRAIKKVRAGRRQCVGHGAIKAASNNLAAVRSFSFANISGGRRAVQQEGAAASTLDVKAVVPSPAFSVQERADASVNSKGNETLGASFGPGVAAEPWPVVESVVPTSKWSNATGCPSKDEDGEADSRSFFAMSVQPGRSACGHREPNERSEAENQTEKAVVKWTLVSDVVGSDGN